MVSYRRVSPAADPAVAPGAAVPVQYTVAIEGVLAWEAAQR